MGYVSCRGEGDAWEVDAREKGRMWRGGVCVGEDAMREMSGGG